MCDNRYGKFTGFFFVFLLLNLVAILAVVSLVIQIYTWRLIADEDGGLGMRSHSGRRSYGEPEIARQISANLAQLQVENGAGPTIGVTLDNIRHGYTGDARVWTLGMPYSSQSNLAYYDTSTGEHGGYLVDVVHEVCKVAGKNCHFIGLSGENLFQSCWETSEEFGIRGGSGLHGSWLDACVGFSPTLVRNLVFDFSESIVRQTGSYFHVLPGNPSNFDWTNLRGRRIGFLEGWYTDPDCVQRNANRIQGATLEPNQIIYYSAEDIYDALQRREIDATFFADELVSLAEILQIASDKITTCTVDGDALMVRKDSKLSEWFDPALNTVEGSREYREICKDIDDYYNTFLPGRHSEFICQNPI